MNPEILDVKQTTALGAGGVPVAVLQVSWRAGTYGPFTAQSTWQELNSGALMDKLREMARALANLPAATRTT